MDEITIKIIDDGQETEYKTLSGGGKRRVDLAIILAIRDLVNERSGNRSNIFVADEVFDSLDVSGVKKSMHILMDAFKDSQVFLISHDTSLKDAFDNKQVLGLDSAKLVFQMHTVNMKTGEIVNKQLKRKELSLFFANSGSFVIGIEACSGTHCWSRELTALGHEVRLVHAKVVRPFVMGNKTDATDTRGIWLVIQQPGMKYGASKNIA